MLIQDVKPKYKLPELEAMKKSVEKLSEDSDEFIRTYTRDEVKAALKKQQEVMDFIRSML